MNIKCPYDGADLTLEFIEEPDCHWSLICPKQGTILRFSGEKKPTEENVLEGLRQLRSNK